MSNTRGLPATEQFGKRRSYIIAVAIAIAAMVLLWAATGAESSDIALATYPARVVFLAAVLAGLVSGKLSVAVTERVIIATMALFFLARTALMLFGPDELLATPLDVAEPMLLGALLFTLIFVAFDTSVSLRLSLSIYGVFAALVVPGVAPEVVAGAVTERTAIVLAATPLHGAMIALLWVLSSRKEMLARARTQTTFLKEQANTDVMTGVANRRRLEFELDRRLGETARYGQPLSVVLLDLDRFKAVNDQFGHDAGDQVLRDTVDRLAGALRSTDVLGRWGGEEFAVIAPGTGADDAARLAERCRTLVAGTPFPQVGQVSASFGVASYQPGDTMRSLLRRADEALYASKAGGRDRVNVAGEPT